MAADREEEPVRRLYETVAVGDVVPAFVRETGLANWNRLAAVNDEFVPLHMDDEAGIAAGFPGAIGMGNLQWSYLHSMLRAWLGEEGALTSLEVSFRAPNLKNTTVTAGATVTAVRRERFERLHST